MIVTHAKLIWNSKEEEVLERDLSTRFHIQINYGEIEIFKSPRLNSRSYAIGQLSIAYSSISRTLIGDNSTFYDLIIEIISDFLINFSIKEDDVRRDVSMVYCFGKRFISANILSADFLMSSHVVDVAQIFTCLFFPVDLLALLTIHFLYFHRELSNKFVKATYQLQARVKSQLSCLPTVASTAKLATMAWSRSRYFAR